MSNHIWYPDSDSEGRAVINQVLLVLFLRELCLLLHCSVHPPAIFCLLAFAAPLLWTAKWWMLHAVSKIIQVYKHSGQEDPQCQKGGSHYTCCYSSCNHLSTEKCSSVIPHYDGLLGRSSIVSLDRYFGREWAEVSMFNMTDCAAGQRGLNLHLGLGLLGVEGRYDWGFGGCAPKPPRDVTW